MVFSNPVQQAFHMKMIFHDSIEEQEIMLHFLYLLQLFSLTHKFKGLKGSRSLKPFWHVNIKKGKSVCVHVLGMKSHIDRLIMLGVSFPDELAVNWVLQSLLESYNEFKRKYYMMDHDENLIDLT